MAIDTKDRRLSMLNFGEGDALVPDADGSLDAEDRAFLLGLYIGITLGSAAIPVTVSTRYALDGTDNTRMTLNGTNANRLGLIGTNESRLPLEGS
jgi:hypothetical protein